VIEIDLSELVEPALWLEALGAEIEEVVLDLLSSAARAKWEKLAGERLRSTAQTYIQGIQHVESEPGRRVITLLGWLPVAIERGLDPFDMRTTLLGPNASKRRPDGKGGWYANVPMRHGTPGTTGLVGSPMGQPYGPRGEHSRALTGGMTAAAAEAMGKAIYRRALKLKGGKSLPEKHGGPLLAPHHTTGIYTGARRDRKTYQASTGTQYVTFRRISTANPRGWMHPGITARNLSAEVVQHVGRITAATIQGILHGASGGDR